jgi:hypothetical protein
MLIHWPALIGSHPKQASLEMQIGSFDIKCCLQFCYWLLHKNIDEYRRYVPCILDWQGNIHKEWSKQFPLSTLTSTGESWCYSMLFISTKIQHQCLLWNRKQLSNLTACDSEWSQWNPICLFYWNNTDPFLKDAVRHVCKAMSLQHHDAPPHHTSQPCNWLNNHSQLLQISPSNLLHNIWIFNSNSN